ncbi:hypothetical protein B0H21DRAFT_684766 [Amylocystis lapponica]|nr:hypothetical protein B0H21DRAFT_684766 [Amylocystis lapponica]
MPSQDRGRSVSGDLESSDVGSPDGGSSNQPGKPGRKKNPNSQAARRDQNRIAQREFRLRKQQRIRDLEASVEILSGGKDEALTHLRKVLKDLMHENQILRDLLRSLSTFIGDGAGGLLPKLGWDLNDFNNFINRSETDSAWESYQRHKDSGASGSSTTQPVTGQKRAAEDDILSKGKRARGLGEQNGDSPDGFNSSLGPSLMVPMGNSGSSTSASVGGNGIFPSSSRSAASSAPSSLLSEFMRGPVGSPMFVSPSSPPVQYNAQSSAGVGGSYQSSYMQSMNLTPEASLPSVSMVGPTNVAISQTRATPQSQTSSDDELEPKKNEAQKLIHYHLDNYKRNSAYCLPSSLRPTLVQRTVPHESVIDAILHPELRDRMILLRGRFDLVDCLHDYRLAVTIHGDDVLAHSNWEITESWLQRYKFLVDPATLNITNRWRRERGEPELRFGDFTADAHSNAV